MRREFAPLFVMALRASGGSGRHADAARRLVLLMLVARMAICNRGANSRRNAP